MSVDVLVINRAGDTDRLATFTDSAQKHGITPVRIDAHDAHRPDFPFALYDDLIGPHFWGSTDVKPGAIGCFLSHRRAWQHVLDSGAEMALICEDDGVFQTSLGHLADIAKSLNSFDILFANDRLGAWAAATFPAEQVVALPDIVTSLAAVGRPKSAGLKAAPGGDCYLLSRHGAHRLLSITADQKIICGVDWAMVWNALPGDVAGNSNLTDAFPELAILVANSTPADPQITAYVASDPPVIQVPGPSVLRHAVTVPLARLIQRNDMIAHTEFVSALSLGGVDLCFAGRSGPDPVMAAHREGLLWDEPGIRLMLQRFPSGGTFVDIGAHLGNHAVAMGRLGAAGRILAIDANDEILRLLRMNLALNGLAAITTLADKGLALASSAGPAWVLRNRRRSSETMVKTEAPADPDQSTPVTLITGDTWLADTRVHAIKVDTAGSEVDVLKGLRSTIAAQRPQVLIDHAEGSLERIQRLADDLGLFISETVPSSRRRRSSSLMLPKNV